MMPPPLANTSDATVQVVPQIDLDGSVVMVVLLKQRFRVLANGSLDRLGEAEIRLADELWDEKDAQSSVKFPSDLCIRKTATDVILVGSAVAPDRKPVRSLDVLLRVGEMRRILRVHGTRVWFRGAAGVTLSRPELFEEVPLRWELAYGGSDMSAPKGPPLEEPRNPVGRGLARRPEDLLHQPGPQIEDPLNPIDRPNCRLAPVGVAPLGRHYEPRRGYAGTMDRTWLEERMPLLPLDFDDRFNQVAPPELIMSSFLRGGEVIDLLNVSAAGAMRFALPRLHFFVGARIDGEMREHRPVLDTVLLQPTEGRLVEMTWRSTIPMPKRARRCDGITIVEKTLL